MVPLFTRCIQVVLHWQLQRRDFQVFLQQIITTISNFFIAETYLINRWYNPNTVGKQLYIHCLEMLLMQIIPASLQYILLITLYTIHILADVLIQEVGSSSYPFQNWRVELNEQKKKDILCLIKLHSNQKHSSKSLWKKVSGNQLPRDTYGYRAFHLHQF